MNRERAERLRRYANQGYGHVADIEELCDFYLAQTPEPKPKIRPETQIGVPVKIEDADLTGYALDRSSRSHGMLLYRRCGGGSEIWRSIPLTTDTHVMYVKRVLEDG